MQHQVLLLKDLPSGGRKGEIVKAKAGHIRNYLVPYGFGVSVDKRTLRMQEALRAERDKQAAIDRKESVQAAEKIKAATFSIVAKVDPDGHMYGSVSAGEIVKIFAEHGIEIDRRSVRIGSPIRTLGNHTIPLVLKEGVEAFAVLEVKPDRVIEKPKTKVEEKPKEESQTEVSDEALAAEEPSEG